MNRTKLTVAAAAAAVVVVAAIAGLWSYGEYQKREQRKAIAALVGDTSGRLRSALAGLAEVQDAAGKLEEHVAAADRNLSVLKRMNAAREQAFADAADAYLITGREVLRRTLGSERHRQLLSESLPALIGHMRADNRTGGWVREAVKARERVNADYRGYSAETAALDKLLQSLPGSQKGIAPYVGPDVLIEVAEIERARARALSAAKKIVADVEATRRVDAFR